MTEADINPFINGTGLTPLLRRNSIGIGEYPIDSKAVLPKTDLSTPDKGQGDYYIVNASTAFQVPYGSLLPRDTEGLLVPVALSATHVAFSSIRMDPTWTVLGQAAGVAAALSVKRGVLPRALPLADLQAELVAQKLKLAFYWDVEATDPAFTAIQLLSVRGIASGDANRCFRPAESLTRADAAQFVYRAFNLWPSVSNVHFSDVPYTHPKFREIETLFDHGALSIFGIEPQWPKEGRYDAAKHSGFRQKNNFGTLSPDQPVTKAEFARLIHYIQSGEGPLNVKERRSMGAAFVPPKDGAVLLTRGQASILLWDAMDKKIGR
jgi:hypothetical protein